MGKTKFADVNRTKQSTSDPSCACAGRMHGSRNPTTNVYRIICQLIAIKDYFVHLPHLFSRGLPLNRFPYLCRKIEKKQTHQSNQFACLLRVSVAPSINHYYFSCLCASVILGQTQSFRRQRANNSLSRKKYWDSHRLICLPNNRRARLWSPWQQKSYSAYTSQIIYLRI